MYRRVLQSTHRLVEEKSDEMPHSQPMGCALFTGSLEPPSYLLLVHMLTHTHKPCIYLTRKYHFSVYWATIIQAISNGLLPACLHQCGFGILLSWVPKYMSQVYTSGKRKMLHLSFLTRGPLFAPTLLAKEAVACTSF